MYAEPTIPNTSVTPCATSVSTNASEGVIFCLPATDDAPRFGSIVHAGYDERRVIALPIPA